MAKAESTVSRRNMLLGIGGTAACAAVISAPQLSPGVARTTRDLVRATPFLGAMVTLELASMDEWTALVDSRFEAEGGYRLRLAGVRPLESGGARPWNLGRDRAFLALFDVEGGLTMAGDLIYTLAHAERGRVPVLLTASVDPATPGRMFAVFN